MVQFSPVMFDARLDQDAEATAFQAHADAGAVSRAEIRLSVHEDIAAIECDWREFQARADGTVFQTHEWLSTWQRHIGARRGVRPAIVMGRNARGEVVLLLPLAIERVAFARRLGWLGADLCDYNAPLLAEDFSRHVSLARFEQLWSEVLLRLRSHPRLGFDLISLEQMPEMVGQQRNPILHLGTACHPNRAYAVSLAESWEKLYAKRSSATRRHDRSKRNKLAEHGALTCVHAADPAEITRTFEVLTEQKARWFAEMGLPDMFARPGCREFFLDIATNPRTRHVIQISRLDVGNVTAATSVGLLFRDNFYYVLASYDRASPFSRFAPGTALLHELMRFAIGRGLRTFDLSVGAERYKHEWCDSEVKLYDHVGAVSLRGVLAAISLVAVRLVKRGVKSHPALWHGFRKARARLGSLFR